MKRWEGTTEITVERDGYFDIYEVAGICKGKLLVQSAHIERIFGSQLCELGDCFRGTLSLTIEVEEE